MKSLLLEQLEQRAVFSGSSFSIAVLPDTQYYSQSYPQIFSAQTQWIVNNIQNENIKFVSHLGDIVQSGESGTTRNLTQWQRADAAMDLLDGNLAALPDGLVPYSTALGNHDYRVVSDKLSGSARYQEFFGPNRYLGRSWYVEDSLRPGAHAQIFEAAGYRFLHLTVQYEALDQDLDWAKDLIDRYSGLPTIVTTHSYLNPSNNRRQSVIQGDTNGDPNPGNTGEEVFRKFISQNPQIFLVMNGHFSGEYHQVSQNMVGEDVLEMVVDYQSRSNGGDGWMRLLEIDVDQGTILAKSFSPTLNQLETDSNSQFTIPIDFKRRFGLPEKEATKTFAFQDGRVVDGVVYGSTKDTQLRQANPTTSYGSLSSALLVDDSETAVQNASHALLAFENIIGVGAGKIPIGSQIIQARLLVDSVNPGHGGSLHRMLRTWNENDTWNTLTNGVSANGIEASSQSTAQFGTSQLTIIPTQGNLQIDVTSDLQAWANGQANHGWAILPWTNGIDGWSFSPSEAASLYKRPQLIVTWLPPSNSSQPLLSAPENTISFVEDSSPVQPFVNLTVQSSQPGNSRIEVKFANFLDQFDWIGFHSSHVTNNALTIVGQQVYLHSRLVAVYGGGMDRVPLTIDFASNATTSDVEEVLRELRYLNSSDAPQNLTKQIRLTMINGSDRLSNRLEKTIRITPMNDSPIIIPTQRDISYAANGSPVVVDPGISVTDSDSVDLGGGEATISLIGSGHVSDRIFVSAKEAIDTELTSSGWVFTYNGLAIARQDVASNDRQLVLSFLPGANGDAISQLLRAVAFETEDSKMLPESRVIRFSARDKEGAVSQSLDYTLRQSQVVSSVFQQGSDNGFGVYSGTVDLQIDQSSPNTSYTSGSGNSGLFVDYDAAGAETQVLLRFDDIFGDGPGKIPLGAKIASARLVLHTVNPGDGASFHRMLSSWGSNATWNSFASGGTWNSVGGVQPDGREAQGQYGSQVGVNSGNGDAEVGPTMIGVTTDLQAWANGESNHGWVLKGWTGQTNGWGFFSSEYTDRFERPRLEVDWIASTFSSLVFQEGIDGYNATMDTQLRQDFPTSNYSASTTLFSDHNSVDPNNELQLLNDQSQVLIKFDAIVGHSTSQIPPGSIIHSATLTLASMASNAPGDGGTLHAMLRPWNDSSTWNSLSNGITANGVESRVTPTAIAGTSSVDSKVNGGWNEYDVTSDVQQWVTGANENHGWVILPHISGQDGWGIQSSEWSSIPERPKLKVVYTAPNIRLYSEPLLVVSEVGEQREFLVVLDTPPTAEVVLPILISQAGQVSLSQTELRFDIHNWDQPQTITIIGLDDFTRDGNQDLTIQFGPAVSSDTSYAGRGLPNIAVRNLDNGLAPAIVESVRIGDGSDQRSMLTSILITFNTIVDYSAQSFVLDRYVGGVFVPVQGSQINVTVTDTSLMGRSRVLITFSGSAVVGGSLPDGDYRLRVLADRVFAEGLQLDGDGDGLAGGDFAIGESAFDRLFRLYGDVTGEGFVNALDINEFRKALGAASFSMDYDASGSVNTLDINQFRQRIGKSRSL